MKTGITYEMQDLTPEIVERMIRKMWAYPKKPDPNEKFFETRKIDIFFSRGYDDPRYTTVLFCVKGSPNKLFGWITFHWWCCHICDKRHFLMAKTNKGNFFFSGENLYTRTDSRESTKDGEPHVPR